MEYISISWYYCPELNLPIMMSLKAGSAYKEATEPKIVMVKFKSYLEILMVVTKNWLTAAEFLSHKWQWICFVCVITFPIHYILHGLIKKEKVTRWVPHVEQELPTLPEDRVHPRFLVCLVLLDLLFSVFVDQCLSLCFIFIVLSFFDLIYGSSNFSIHLLINKAFIKDINKYVYGV
jgi:hypothetical protein